MDNVTGIQKNLGSMGAYLFISVVFNSSIFILLPVWFTASEDLFPYSVVDDHRIRADVSDLSYAAFLLSPPLFVVCTAIGVLFLLWRFGRQLSIGDISSNYPRGEIKRLLMALAFFCVQFCFSLGRAPVT